MADTSTRFTAGAIVPALEVWGGYQRFEFDDHFVKLQAYNKFIPFGGNSSVTSIESINNNLAGFRFRHVTDPTSFNNYGTFSLNFFNNAADTTGTNIFIYELGDFHFAEAVSMLQNLTMMGNRIINVAAGIAGTDAVNVDQMNAAVATGGSVTLTGDVTGTGTAGTPFATTLTLRLNEILVPNGDVSLNSKKINSLANGTLSSDGVNLGQMTSAISAAVSAGTITLTGNVTGSGTVGSSFATTLTLRLNQILTPNAAVAMGGFKLTGLATGTAGTDAVNLTQMNSAISSAVSAGTITLTGNVTGSGTVGSSFATSIASRLNQIPTPTGAVNMNSQNLVSVGNIGVGVPSPTLGIQFPNTVDDCKLCLYQNSANSFQVYGFGVTSATLKYSVGNSVASHVFYCGASSTTSTELFRITGTGNVGIGGVSSPNVSLQFTDVIDTCKISLYQTAANKFQVFGFGISSGTLRYSVPSTSNVHVFYAGTSSTTSTEMFRIASNYATVDEGVGTMYARVPSIQIHGNGAAINTIATDPWVKLNTHAANTAAGSVQFTASTNRITFTGSDLGNACVGFVSASVTIYISAVTQVLIAVAKNGSIINQSVVWVANVSTSIPVSVVTPPSMVSLSPGDYLEIWVFGGTIPTPTVGTQAMVLSFNAC